MMTGFSRNCRYIYELNVRQVTQEQFRASRPALNFTSARMDMNLSPFFPFPNMLGRFPMPYPGRNIEVFQWTSFSEKFLESQSVTTKVTFLQFTLSPQPAVAPHTSLV
jgi:hypothetical protein